MEGIMDKTLVNRFYLDKEKVFYLLHIVYEHLFSEPLPIVKTAIYRSKEGGMGLPIELFRYRELETVFVYL